METINLNADRVLLERCENGVILYDLDSKGEVKSRVVYEIHFKDGMIDFQKMAYFFYELSEFMGYSLQDKPANLKLEMYVEKIEPDKPSYGDTPAEDKPEEED